MKRCLFAIFFFVFVTVSVITAQEQPPQPPQPRQPGGERGPFRPEGQIAQRVEPSAMEIDGDFAYCVIGTTVFKVGLEKMELVAKQSLESAGEKPEDLIKRADKDGDGKISKAEFSGPQEMFGRLDRDGDGFLTKEEIPADGLRRLTGVRRSGTPPVIRFTKEKVVILLGGTVYKLAKSNLALEGAIHLEGEGGQKPPEAPKKEEKKEDFGF
ncbi:MAG: EF-hand domain-containing protein [Planctomycetota bacterium]|nr:EF-hand domain-containing protein [Planctomycetota bacterium]